MPRCYMVKKDPAPLEGIPPCSPTEASVAPPCYTPHDTVTGPRPAQYAETTRRVGTQYKEPRTGDFAENSGGESTSPCGAASRQRNGIYTVLRAAKYADCLDENFKIIASPETISEVPHSEEYTGPRTVRYLEQDFSATGPRVVEYAKQEVHCDETHTTDYAELNIDNDGARELHDVKSQVVEMEAEEDEETNYAELLNMSDVVNERSAADTEAAHELLSLAAGVPPLPPAETVTVVNTPEPALPIYTYALQPTSIYIIADEPTTNNLYATTLQTLAPLQQVELTAKPQVSTYIIQQPVPALTEQYQPLFDGAEKSGIKVGEPVSVISIAPASENVKTEPHSVQVSVVEPVPQLQSLPTPDSEETASRCIKNKKNNYNCNDCGKRYATSSNLSRHKQTHRSLDSQAAKLCGECGKAYVSMPALAMHVLTHRMGFVCGVCGKQFSRPWLLRGHLRSHTGEKPYNCSSCYKSFADRSNLRAHLQTHTGDKRWECTRCNKTFALKSYLNKHQEAACSQDEEAQ